MLIKTKDKIAVLEYLMKEGVVVAPDENQLKRHPNIRTVPNWHVVKLLEGMAVRGHVKKTYAWKHHYFFLTNEGIEFLRDYLHLPSTVVPATMKKRSGQPERTQSRPVGRGKGFSQSYRQ